MSRINTNIPSLTAQHNLAVAQRDLSTSLRRLSSGIKINTAADDPAGLIISELLRSEIASTGRAISNTQRAVNIIATTEGGLNEVNSLLVDIRDKVVEAASTGALSNEEIEANQLQIDSAVRSIGRIANSTQFGGKTLLNGNLDYTYASTTAGISGTTVYAAQFGTNSNMTVTLNVTNTASAAYLAFSGSAIGGADVTIEFAGDKGSEVLSFVAGTDITEVVTAVNAVKEITGVSAALSGAGQSGMVLNSVDVGSAEFVSVNVLAGAYATYDAAGVAASRDEGGDAVASVNGAATDAKGNALLVNQAQLQARIDLATTAAGAESFVVSGGALFQIGTEVNISGQYNIGISSANPARLGRAGIGWLNQITTGGAYSLAAGSNETTQKIVDEATVAVSTLRGRLGALQRNTFETNINSLRVSLENVTAAESDIRDTDFAAETSAMTRAQILVAAGTTILQMANSIPQNVLALLGG